MNKTLKGITWDHPRGYQPLVACSARYEREHNVRVEWYKRSLTEFGDQSLEELCGTFDLLIIDHPHVGLGAYSGCIEPLNKILSEDELSSFSDQSAGPSYFSYAYNGYQWALPIDAAMQTAAYRPDLLSAGDIPYSWAQVFELARSLAEKKQYVGMALSPTDCLCTFLTLTAQANSPICEHGSKLVDSAIGVAALRQMTKMKELFHPLCLEWTPVQLYDYMSYHNDLIYSPLSFCYNNYSRKGFGNCLIAFDNPPDIKNAVLGGAGIALSSTSTKKNLAKDYISWVCSTEIQRTVYIEEQGQPGNREAWLDESANQISNNFFKNTIQAIQESYVRPRYYGWTTFQTQLGNIIHDYLQVGGDEAEIIDQLDHLYQNSKLGL